MIEARGLTKRYGPKTAVDDMTFTVRPGKVTGFLGPNGAGKSTLIKTLLNIWRPSSGTAEILGIDSRRLGPGEFQRIGYVSEGQQLPEWMSVGSFLSYCRGFYEQWDDALAAALVRLFDLPPDRKLSHLSRGMRMKVALVSALAYRPELIILDEPFSGLDVLIRDELIESILDRASESTVLLASHDLAEIENFATHIAYIDQGRLWFTDEMSSVRDRFREVEITLDGPADLPASWPREWLHADRAGVVVRFIDTSWSPETELRARGFFPNLRLIETRGLPLRSVFVALAKSTRQRKGAAA